MLLKDMISDLLSSLVETDDQMARMEMIDSAEVLNTDIPESEGDGNDYKQMYEDMKQKFTDRFVQELRGGTETKTKETETESNTVEEELVDDVEVEEVKEPQSMDEAGFSGIDDMKKGRR